MYPCQRYPLFVIILLSMCIFMVGDDELYKNDIQYI